MLEGMHLLELNGAWSFAPVSLVAVALSWLTLMVVISLVACKGNVAECLGLWRIAFSQGFERLARRFRGPQPKPDSRAAAKQLSDVLQIPLIDAELSLELSRAFFDPSGDPRLNSEALELLRAPLPRNETWRSRASECSKRLSSRDRRLEPAR
jgi:hypothetical protein